MQAREGVCVCGPYNTSAACVPLVRTVRTLQTMCRPYYANHATGETVRVGGEIDSKFITILGFSLALERMRSVTSEPYTIMGRART